MVRHLPARQSHSAFSIVRKKANSGVASPKPRARSKFLSTGVRLIVAMTVIGLVLATALYSLFQVMVQQALKAGTQTVVYVPESVTDAPSEVLILSLGQNISDSTLLTLSGETVVTMPGDYGEYRLGAVYPLLKMEGKDQQYIQASVSRSLGVVVDAVIPARSYLHSSSQFRRMVLQSMWRWIWQRDEQSIIFLKSWLVLKQQLQPHVVESVTAVQQQLAHSEGSQRSVAECPVGILNGSKTAGAASTLSKLLEANQIITIRVGTFPQDVGNSIIYHDGRPECIPVLKRVSSVLLQKPQLEYNTQMTTQYRSGIIIVLGKDW